MSLTDHPEYKALAFRRLQSAPETYLQPEQLGYDFSEWVSPYTKGACKVGGIAIVLQDWASEDGLAGDFNECIALLGRDPTRPTNRVLARLLFEALGTCLADTFATNVFPYVKPGAMSAPIPQSLANQTARDFTARELEIVSPMLILALGKIAQTALQSADVRFVSLPHPAARIGFAAQREAWRKALS